MRSKSSSSERSRSAQYPSSGSIDSEMCLLMLSSLQFVVKFLEGGFVIVKAILSILILAAGYVEKPMDEMKNPSMSADMISFLVRAPIFAHTVEF